MCNSDSLKEFIPFGFQYYRAPTPFKSEWDRDLKNIASGGFNTVKLWVQWRSSHLAPEHFDFSDIEEIMDLCHKYNLKVVLNLIFDTVPVWIFKQYPDAKMITASGQVLEPVAIPCRQLGGTGSLCFHHAEASNWKQIFLKETVKRFKDHPALIIWDLWNEPELTTGVKRELSFDNQVCYCSNSLEGFARWLESKYGCIEALNAKWQRNYSGWTDVEPPRCQGTFNDMVDWRMFFVDTITEEFKRHRDIVKSMDNVHPIMCHTVPFPVFNIVTCGSDDFALAEHCDLFGNSLGSSAWAADLLKSAAGGKRIINSEIHAMPGSTQLKPQKLDWKTLKRHILIPLSKGITGFLFWQYRPEILGLESPAWGHTYMDGGETPWLKETVYLNGVIQDNRKLLLNSSPASDKIAILFPVESQAVHFSIYRNLDILEQTMQGIYRLLYDLNYKVEFIRAKELERCLYSFKCLWLPFPVYMDAEMCDVIRDWVAEGGVLVSECSFGSIRAEDGLHSFKIPAYGFNTIFGVQEKWNNSLEYMNNSYHDDTFKADRSIVKIQGKSYGGDIEGGYYYSEVECLPNTEILCEYIDGSGAAITCSRFGKGAAVWIGTLVGAAYYKNAVDSTRNFFSKLLATLEILPSVNVEGQNVRVDILEGNIDEGMQEICMFVENIGAHEETAWITLEGKAIKKCTKWFDDGNVFIANDKIRVVVEPGDLQVFVCTCRIEKEEY